MIVYKQPPIIEQWRGTTFVRQITEFKSFTRSAGLNEVREPELSLPLTYLYKVLNGDIIRVYLAGVKYEDYRVHIVINDASETDGGVSLTLEPSCGSVLRCAATSGATVFDNLTVVDTFTTIGKYILDETGSTIPLVFVNPNNFNFTGRLNASGRNMLEVLRTLCGSSGNSFRVKDTCAVEVGQFGEDSGLAFVGPGNDHGDVHLRWLSSQYTEDVSEVTSALYVEGGGYHKEGSSDNFTLLMGDNTTGGATQYSTVPAGYVIELIKRNSKDYFRLRKIGATGCTRAINIGGVSPLGEKLKEHIYPAQQLMTNIAVKYLEIKSQAVRRVDLVCPWCIVDLVIGQKARVRVPNGEGGYVVDEMMYINEYEHRFQGETITTAVTLSNRLYDPDELLSSSNQNVNEKGDKTPVTASGSITQTISFTATLLNAACNTTGRLVNIDYSGSHYTAQPTLVITVPPGVTYSVINADKSSAQICIVATAYPQTGTVVISGPA